MALIIRGERPTGVFHLSGEDENSATFAVGWVLEQSHAFRVLVVKEIFGEELEIDDVAISAQKHRALGGFTDVEIQAGLRFHAILEAKVGWAVPSLQQFQRYHPRLVAEGAERQRLVSVSAADEG